MTLPKLNATFFLNEFDLFISNGLFETLFRTYSHSQIVLIILFATFTALFIYWLFYVPFRWSKTLYEVGYGLALRTDGRLKSHDKRDAINRLRKLRIIGSKELPPPYPNGWYAILESSKLKPGEARNVACLGEQFVVFRTLDQEVFVLDAYCPHLGANLGIGGRVVGKNIVCPFHEWSFRGEDGICTNVPYSSCAPNGSKLRKWISKEVNEMIFIWYHVEIDEQPWDLPTLEEIDNKTFVFHGSNEFYVNCHIQEIPENGADLAHFEAIHCESIFAGAEEPKKSVLANAGYHRWQAVWKPSSGADKHRAAVKVKHSIEITKNLHFFNMDVTGHQIGPSYVDLHMISPTLGQFHALQTVTPIEPLLQKVVHRFYGPRALGPIMKFIVAGESIMFERDMAIWNNKVYCGKPQLVKEDTPLKMYRNWYSQFYSANSKTFAEANNNLDW